MAHSSKKIEGGQGGKKGHSNMSHWEKTEEIKKGSKKARRAQDKKLERDAKFESFLDTLKTKGHEDLIETVKTGFKACHSD